jgi:hypothetical protein
MKDARQDEGCLKQKGPLLAKEAFSAYWFKPISRSNLKTIFEPSCVVFELHR